MAMKDDAGDWIIKEQIIEDPASGLILQFEVVPDDDYGLFRLRIFGDLPFGNREILFSRDGRKTGSGTAVAGLSRPSWLTQID